MTVVDLLTIRYWEPAEQNQFPRRQCCERSICSICQIYQWWFCIFSDIFSLNNWYRKLLFWVLSNMEMLPELSVLKKKSSKLCKAGKTEFSIIWTIPLKYNLAKGLAFHMWQLFQLYLIYFLWFLSALFFFKKFKHF